MRAKELQSEKLIEYIFLIIGGQHTTQVARALLAMNSEGLKPNTKSLYVRRSSRIVVNPTP